MDICACDVQVEVSLFGQASEMRKLDRDQNSKTLSNTIGGRLHFHVICNIELRNPVVAIFTSRWESVTYYRTSPSIGS